MKHFLKRILLSIMIVSLIFTSLDINNKKAYAADPVTDIILTKVILEMLAASAISYGVDNDISDELDEVFNGKLYDLEKMDKIVLEKMELTEMQRLFIESNGAGYATWYYDEVYDKVVYNDGEQISPTIVDGVKKYLNPILVSWMKSLNVWTNVMKANVAMNSMAITTLFVANQYMKLDLTDSQITTANATKDCFHMICSAMQSVKNSKVLEPEGYTQEQIDQIANDTMIQGFRYANVPQNIKTLYDNNPYYAIFEILYGQFSGQKWMFVSPVPITVINYDGWYQIGDWSTNLLTRVVKQGDNYVTLSGQAQGIWPDTGVVSLSNSPMVIGKCTGKYGSTSFPYPLNNTDTVPLEVQQKASFGAFKYIIDNSLVVPSNNVLDMTDDQIISMMGEQTDEQYKPVTNIDVPQSNDTNTLLRDSNTLVTSILKTLPGILSIINTSSNSIVDGLSSSFASTMDGLLKGKDEEGNPVYVPTLLGKIYDNLLDTPGILGGIKGLMEKLEEQVRTQAKAQEQARAEDKANDKAIADEVTTALPSGGGGLFQLITSLIMILLMLLYLFLRCLQFIVLLFQVPSSTAFITPGMVQGLNWLKTTKLIGHSDAKLTFNAVSQSNSVGLNITIWGFMIGIVNLLILFYIIRIIRKYSERMKG